MIRRASLTLPAIALVISLGSCTVRDDGFPSLLPRPIEQRSDAEPVVAPTSPIADPALDTDIVRLEKALADTKAAFDASTAKAERLARYARGATAGDSRWLDAQVALAELDVLRGETGNVVMEINQLEIGRSVDAQAEDPRLTRLIGQAADQTQSERERVDAVAAALPVE